MKGGMYMGYYVNNYEMFESFIELYNEEYYVDKSLIIEFGKPNPIKLINSDECHLVTNIDKLTPNYIQLVEAERKRRGLLWE